MNIREVIEKIKNILMGRTIKQLPEASADTKAIQQSKSNIRDELKVDIHTEQPIQMSIEDVHNQLVEENTRLIAEEDALMSEIALIANGVEYSENENLVELAKKKREEAVQEAVKGKKGDLEIVVLKKFAEGTWDANIDKYISSGARIVSEMIRKQSEGENVVLSEEEKRNVAYIRKLIDICMKQATVQGRIQGINMAVLKHDVSSSQNLEAIDRIEKEMEIVRKIGVTFLDDAEVHALETSGVTEVDRIIYQSDRDAESIDGGLNLTRYQSYQESLSRYNDVIEHGGIVTSMNPFLNPVEYSKYGKMSKKRMEEMLDKYERRYGKEDTELENNDIER